MNLAILFPQPVLHDGTGYTIESYVQHQFYHLRHFFKGLDFIVRMKYSADKRYKEVFNSDIITIHGLPFYKSEFEMYFLKSPLIFWRLLKIFRKYQSKWDVVMLYDPSLPCQVAALLAKFYKIPAVFFLSARLDFAVKTRAENKGMLYRWLAPVASTWYKVIIALMVKHFPTVVSGRELLKYYARINPNILKIFPTTVRKNDILSRPFEQPENIGITRILSICRIDPCKGIEYALQTMKILKKKGLKFIYNIVGPVSHKDYYKYLIDQIAELGIRDVVSFIGAVSYGDELMEWYQNSHIFILSSITETGPKTLPEAMAAGLPVVATKVGSVPEMVTHGREGFIVNPRDPIAMANFIEKLIMEPSLRHKMAKSALARVNQYTVENQMALLSDFLQRNAQVKLK